MTTDELRAALADRDRELAAAREEVERLRERANLRFDEGTGFLEQWRAEIVALRARLGDAKESLTWALDVIVAAGAERTHARADKLARARAFLAATPSPATPPSEPPATLELLVAVAREAENLLASLGEYVRQSMHRNPEWSRGVGSLEAALLAAKRAGALPPLPIRTFEDEPAPSEPPAHGEPARATVASPVGGRIVDQVARFRRRLHAYRSICAEAGVPPIPEDEDRLLDSWSFIYVRDPADDPDAPMANAPVAPAPTPAATTGGPYPPRAGDVWRDRHDAREWTFDGTSRENNAEYWSASWADDDAYGSSWWHKGAFTDGALTFVRSAATTGGQSAGPPPKLERLRELALAASPGPWRAMRDGNQYLGTGYMSTARLVGASRVEDLPRPWNPHAMLAFGLKAEGHEVARFIDADADYIEAVQPSAILALLDAFATPPLDPARVREQALREAAQVLVALGDECVAKAKAEGVGGRRDHANQYWAAGGYLDKARRAIEALAAVPPVATEGT